MRTKPDEYPSYHVMADLRITTDVKERWTERTNATPAWIRSIVTDLDSVYRKSVGNGKYMH